MPAGSKVEPLSRGGARGPCGASGVQQIGGGCPDLGGKAQGRSQVVTREGCRRQRDRRRWLIGLDRSADHAVAGARTMCRMCRSPGGGCLQRLRCAACARRPADDGDRGDRGEGPTADHPVSPLVPAPPPVAGKCVLPRANRVFPKTPCGVMAILVRPHRVLPAAAWGVEPGEPPTGRRFRPGPSTRISRRRRSCPSRWPVSSATIGIARRSAMLPRRARVAHGSRDGSGPRHPVDHRCAGPSGGPASRPAVFAPRIRAARRQPIGPRRSEPGFTQILQPIRVERPMREAEHC